MAGKLISHFTYALPKVVSPSDFSDFRHRVLDAIVFTWYNLVLFYMSQPNLYKMMGNFVMLQFARKGGQCADAILLIRLVVQLSMMWNVGNLCGLSIALIKAFDSINKSAVFNVLLASGLEKELISNIFLAYQSR